MIFDIKNTNELSEKDFRNPSSVYRGLPFWSWNCKVTKKLIDKQLVIFKEMGFGGVVIHPRTGLDTEYLGDEYIELTKYASLKCGEMGLYCWLYDDDRFPSGAAGGIVTREIKNRGRYLVLHSISLEQVKNYDIVYYVKLSDSGNLSEYKRITDSDDITLSKNSQIRAALVKLLDEERWFEGQTYLDTLNKDAVDDFIDSTHKKYKVKMGELFNTSSPAIFTDEPRMAPRKKNLRISSAFSEEDILIPYSESVADFYKSKYKEDIFDMLPEYVWDDQSGRPSTFRYRYQDALSECFTRAFMDNIADWCKENGIAMTGHVLSEDSLTSQIYALGECMRVYRKMDIPGIDVLVDDRNFLAVKQAVSVQRQLGKEGVVSELYGVTQWDCSFKTFKLQGDWQAALGVTFRVPHLSWMSMEGEAKRDWPGSIFYQSPWYKKFSIIEDYFGRLNLCLSRGKAIVRVGMIHPVESAWLYMGAGDILGDKLKSYDNAFSETVSTLLKATIDYDLISESILADNTQILSDYEAIILPRMLTIRSTTLKCLDAFLKNGGKVIILGQKPRLINGKTPDEYLDRQAILYLTDICKCENVFCDIDLIDALSIYRDIMIRNADGLLSENIFYQLRKDGECMWLFLSHVYPKKSDYTKAEHYTVNIKGLLCAQRYDALSGEISDFMLSYNDAETSFEWECYGEDSLLLRLRKGIPEVKDESQTFIDKDHELLLNNALEQENVTVLKKLISVTRDEPNMLLLDRAKVLVDSELEFEEDDILRLDNKIRRNIGFTPHGDEVEQPWFLDEKETHEVTLEYLFESEADLNDVSLALEHPEMATILLNDNEIPFIDQGYYVDECIRITPISPLNKGTNRLVIKVLYNQKSSLEPIYLLGNFGVKLIGNKGVLTSEEDKGLGDVTRQGLPFYTGNLNYSFLFESFSDKEYTLQLLDLSAPVASVYVDGKEVGNIAFSPHRLSLGHIQKGQHTITVKLYGNRHNGFGPLHNANEEFLWVGPAAYRMEGENYTSSYIIREWGLKSEPIVYWY